MKCCIRRYDTREQTWKDGWFVKHLWDTENHWTIFKNEAKKFETVKEARNFIKTHKLKNCGVEYER